MMHVTFEYRGKEYNYSALPDDFKVIFKMGLRELPLNQVDNERLQDLRGSGIDNA
jgi:hypothetical protein